MNWFIFAILAPMLWAAINHIDGFVISRYAHDRRPEALVIFSSLTAGLAAFLILIFANLKSISFIQASGGILAGILFVGSYILYMYALKEDEVSIVAPLWQMVIPVSYILGVIFLHELLSLKQILASSLVLLGSVLLTLNFKKLIWKWHIFKLMLWASLLISFNTLVFKIIGLESSFWTASFWEYLGAFIFGVFLLSIKSYRIDFKNFLSDGGRTIVSLNLLAESINVLARLFFNFAAILGPIALVYAINGTQPFFILLFGFIISVFLPKIEKENFSGIQLCLKILAVIMMFAGSLFLFL